MCSLLLSQLLFSLLLSFQFLLASVLLLLLLLPQLLLFFDLSFPSLLLGLELLADYILLFQSDAEGKLDVQDGRLVDV